MKKILVATIILLTFILVISCGQPIPSARPQAGPVPANDTTITEEETILGSPYDFMWLNPGGGYYTPSTTSLTAVRQVSSTSEQVLGSPFDFMWLNPGGGYYPYSTESTTEKIVPSDYARIPQSDVNNPFWFMWLTP